MPKFETADPLRRAKRPAFRRPAPNGQQNQAQTQQQGPGFQMQMGGARPQTMGGTPGVGVPMAGSSMPGGPGGPGGSGPGNMGNHLAMQMGPGPSPNQIPRGGQPPMNSMPQGGPVGGSGGPQGMMSNNQSLRGLAPQQEEWKEFHLRACTSQELSDSRYHIVKFQARNKVDIKEQFTPPIRFQRKDPKNLQMTVGEQQEEEEKQRSNLFKKRKTHQVLGGTDQEGEAARKLRQEEHLPWVMEDFDGSNAWVSSYEAAQSDSYVVFVFDHFGFKMIPVEKWYKMQSRNKFASLSLDQAEERMQKKDLGHNRWIMDRLQAENGVSGKGIQTLRRMRTVEGGEERGINGEEMDYDEEFADDEEAPLIDGPEEDLKEVQERIKKEQLQATHPSVAKEEEDDDLFGDDQEIDKQGKKLRRYLRSLEKNAYYDSDDDDNPYASNSDNDSEPEIKQESDSHGVKSQQDPGAPSLVVFRRKNIKNLPHGFAVIQLPTNILRKFPEGEWNPKVPRREGQPVQQKTHTPPLAIHQQSTSQLHTSPEPMSPVVPVPPQQSQYSAANTPDATLLTSEDVSQAIEGKSLSISELISALKKKLKQNKENKDRLRVILKEVAQVKEGKLVLV